jgi:hypothetical protein
VCEPDETIETIAPDPEVNRDNALAACFQVIAERSIHHMDPRAGLVDEPETNDDFTWRRPDRR